MRVLHFLAASAVGALPLVKPVVADDCKTVTPLSDVDLTEFLRATWYTQQQQVVKFQSTDDLYCVAATYALENRTVPFFDGLVISVYNYATEDEVNGEPQNTADGMVLCARLEDANITGKLAVSPCWLPNIAAAPYWIVAIHADDDGKYDWAVISGGQPTELQDDGGCTTSTGSYAGGLWIFSRDPVASNQTLADAQAAAVDLGISLAELNDVPQDGCTYDGALIKPN
ncbi:hypothetical protein CTAYLR_003218 [Chrysophaeum taylorii]|uniref:Uncharacterized protein n=1 Tax=Chrysophaeum taylorii TaxID=2483200 RepID=A0AAD7UAH3_9STRA|nr:hypothetical protein CTAYLR_003218 [Chrysophaeum taylorii]